MNKSDHKQVTSEIKSKLKDILINSLQNSDNLKKMKELNDLLNTCDQYKIGTNRIIDAIDDNLNQIKYSEDLVGSARQGRDEFFTVVSNKIVNRVAGDLAPKIFDFTITKIKTEKNEYGAQVSIPLFSKTIKPYVQFSLVQGPTSTGKIKLLRINFEIKASGEISDLGIMVVNHEKRTSGKLHYEIEGSLVNIETDYGTVSLGIELAKKEFDVELNDCVM